MTTELHYRILNSFHSARVLVMGDVMLDRFVYGSVERISPEAPIPSSQPHRAHSQESAVEVGQTLTVSTPPSPIGTDTRRHELA